MISSHQYQTRCRTIPYHYYQTVVSTSFSSSPFYASDASDCSIQLFSCGFYDDVASSRAYDGE